MSDFLIWLLNELVHLDQLPRSLYSKKKTPLLLYRRSIPNTSFILLLQNIVPFTDFA